MRTPFLALSIVLMLAGCTPTEETESDSVPPDSEVPATGEVGATPGAMSVTDNGAARYEISLWTPPARRGIGPSLTLRYNSHAQNGIAGVGWTIDGIPSITRCRKTYARDGFPAGVTFIDAHDGDRYCLDGRRLTLASNSPAPYGAAGSEYRTEPDTHVKVVLANVDVHGPVDFVVFQANGSIASMGGPGATIGGTRVSVTTSQLWNAEASRLDTTWNTTRSQTVRYGWSLARLSDRTGNRMEATYQTIEIDGGYHLRPESLTYTSHASGLPADRGVTFSYEDRPDHERRWISGLLLVQDHRLKRVDAWVRDPPLPNQGGAPIVLSYELGYDQSPTTGRSLLRFVRECAPDNGSTRCLPATEFSYSLAGGFTVPSSAATPPTGPGGGRTNLGALDLDGDGGDELVGAARPAEPNSPSPDQLWQPPMFVDFTGDDLPDQAQVMRAVVDVPGSSSDEARLYLWKRQRNADGTSSLIPISDDADSRGTNSAFFFDLDNDGRPELFRGGAQRFRPNVGVSALTPTGLAPYQTVQPPLSYGPNDRPAIVDIDGSGAGHLLFGDMAFGGPGLSHRVQTTLDPQGARSRLPGDFFADVTGDGLEDSIHPANDGTYFVQINTGRDFLGPELWDVPGNYKGEYLGAAHQAGIRVIDYNLDGRQDLLLMGGVKTSPGNTLGYLVALVSTGTGFTPVRVPDEFVRSDSGAASAGVLDANGDGLQDFEDYLGPHLRESSASDLLDAVTDGLGGSTTLTYRPLVDTAVHTMATTGCTFPVRCVTRGPWVVASLSLDSSGTPRTFTYHYEGGRMDMTGLGWLGFDERTITDDFTGTVTAYQFENTKRVDVITNGVRTHSYYPFAQQVKSSTTVVPVSGTRTIETRTATTFVEAKGANGTWFVHPERVETTEHQIEGSTSRPLGSRAVAQTIDAYGNVVTATITVDRLNAAGGVTGTWRTTRSLIPVNIDSSWLIGLPDRSEVTSASPDGASVSRVTEYDADTGTGLIGKIRVEPDAIGIDESGRSGTGLTVERFYDGFGQLETETMTGSGHTRRRSVVWDPVDHVHPQTLRDTLGHEVIFTVDRRRGLVTDQIDVNGAKTSSIYDAFGRLSKTTAADGSSVEITHAAQGDFTATTATPTSGPPGVLLFDRLGREVGRRWTGPDGSKVGIDTSYDAANRVIHQTRPLLVSDLPDTNLLETFDYDPLGRLEKVSHPDGSSATWEYDGLVTTSRDESGDQQQSTLNELGLPATEEEVLTPTKVLTTSYQYGPFGLPSKITGPDGAVSTMTYDILGRRNTLNDPDTGLETSHFDAFGDLKETTDARGSSVRYERDDLGRVEQTTSDDGVTTYEWDTAPHGAGALAKSTSTTGIVTEYAYDTLGRQRQTTWDLDGERFSIDRSWDAVGRLHRVSYPEVPGRGRFEVDYSYESGALHTITAGNETLWRATAWTPAGQVREEEFGSGSRTTYQYDNVGQLTGIATNRGDMALRSFTYEYDPDGDLYRTIDGVAGTTETFQHDSVGRLTQDTLDSALGTDTRSWTYRDGGALETRTDPTPQGQTTTFYGVDERPHLLTSASTDGVADATFDYDLSGRQIQAPGRSITWTEFDLPATITTASGTTRLAYDAANRRVKRSGADGVQITLGGLYERHTTPTGAVSHLFRVAAGGATVEIEWTGASTSTIVAEWTGASSTNYLHADRLGSVDLVENGTDAVQLRYDPFGARRDLHSGQAATEAPPPQRQGFTGHSHDDLEGIIDMGGRVYDPHLGRFLSADPFVDSAGQGLDRYSYARNRPLTLTDPTGLQSEPTRTVDLPATMMIAHGPATSDNGEASGDSPSQDSDDGVISIPEPVESPVPLGTSPGTGLATPPGPPVANGDSSKGPTVVVSGSSQTAAAARGRRTTGWETILPPTDPGHISTLGQKNSPVIEAVVGAKPLYQAANAAAVASLAAAGGVVVVGLAGGTGVVSALEAVSQVSLNASINLAVTFPRATALAAGLLGAESGFGPPSKGILTSARALETGGDFAKLSGILRDAAKGRGNFGLGTATAEQANAAGRAWVGLGARLARDAKTLVSANGLRQYRPPSYKPNLGRTQANFESRFANEGRWLENGHLDVTP